MVDKGFNPWINSLVPFWKHLNLLVLLPGMPIDPTFRTPWFMWEVLNWEVGLG